jgi:hypothetical protein
MPTFADNARKAAPACNRIGMPTVADDSGSIDVPKPTGCHERAVSRRHLRR